MSLSRLLPFPSGVARSALLAAMVIAATPAAAQIVDDGPRPGRISVTAEGEAAVAPDMAVVRLEVLREGKTAREALDAANAAMEDVLAAMKEEGIEDRDLQTSNFSIQPQWHYPEPKDGARNQPRITGYQISNALTVRIRQIGRLGAVLDKSVSLGVNSGGQIMFTNDDPEGALSEARRAAVGKALAKAQEIARAAGVRLGRITEITEQSRHEPPIPLMRAEMKMSADSAAVPVATGENEYTVTVSMSWEIDG